MPGRCAHRPGIASFLELAPPRAIPVAVAVAEAATAGATAATARAATPAATTAAARATAAGRPTLLSGFARQNRTTREADLAGARLHADHHDVDLIAHLHNILDVLDALRIQ